MSKPKQEKPKTEKHKRAPHFSEPKKRKLHRIKRLFTCPTCEQKVRLNKDQRIAWHRPLNSFGRWCKRSATKFNRILESK